GYEWATPWREHALPRIVAICERKAPQTIFTRFIPAERPGEGRGSWARYYQRWASMTLEKIGADAVRLTPELERYSPPARQIDKRVDSPWTEGALDRLLAGSGARALVVTGGETDMCVLAAVLGAVDRGYRVVIAADAICSSSDEAHDASMTLYLERFGEQIEVAGTEEIIESWR